MTVDVVCWRCHFDKADEWDWCGFCGAAPRPSREPDDLGHSQEGRGGLDPLAASSASGSLGGLWADEPPQDRFECQDPEGSWIAMLADEDV